MPDLIFLSYSRRDVTAVRALYNDLTSAGYSLWFDEESLLPGQDWQLEIRKALTTSEMVLICLSSTWLDKRGYVHKEMKLAREIMGEMPEGRIHIIPLKLDDCPIPPSLAHLHWVELYEPEGLTRLKKALDYMPSARGPVARAEDSAAMSSYSEFMEDVIAKGGLLHIDPWRQGHSQDELDFKRLLKGRWDDSLDYFNSKQYESVIAVWAPLEGNPYFRVDHNEWRDKPYFRAQIQSAKAQLFIAYVQLDAATDVKLSNMGRAFRTLEEVLDGPPYSMKGGAPDRLHADDALTQNLNYKQTLEFALEWFDAWGGHAAMLYDRSPEEADALEQRVHHRLAEIQYILNVRGAAD